MHLEVTGSLTGQLHSAWQNRKRLVHASAGVLTNVPFLFFSVFLFFVLFLLNEFLVTLAYQCTDFAFEPLGQPRYPLGSPVGWLCWAGP